MSPLAYLRRVVRPTGSHRGARQPEPMLRPTEALVQDMAYCPAEEADRLHVFLTTGGRICWTCRTLTDHGPLTSTPPRDGAE